MQGSNEGELKHGFKVVLGWMIFLFLGRVPIFVVQLGLLGLEVAWNDFDMVVVGFEMVWKGSDSDRNGLKSL